MHLHRVVAAIAVGFAAVGCFEAQVRIDLHMDGSALVDVRSAFFESVIDGTYGQIERNDIAPVDAAQVAAMVNGIPGAQLVSVDVTNTTPAGVDLRNVGSLRNIRYSFRVADVNEVRFDHLRVAYYPWRDRRYFQFRFDKDVTYDPESARSVQKMGLNIVGSALTKGRAIDVDVRFPGKVLDGNAQSVEWAEAHWRIPLPELVSGLQPTIVAWAELPAPAADTWTGWWTALTSSWSGQGWRDPQQLPRDALWQPLPAGAPGSAPAGDAAVGQP